MHRCYSVPCKLNALEILQKMQKTLAKNKFSMIWYKLKSKGGTWLQTLLFAYTKLSLMSNNEIKLLN